jgi:large subunit ribosomal protein L25
MSTQALEAQIRNVTGKKVKILRAQGWLPATIYGKGIEPLTVQIDDKAFNKAYRTIGRSALIELNIPGKAMQSAFVQNVQRHPVTRNILHAEFRVVDLKIATDVEVPITLTGESPVVKRNDGMINHVMHSIIVHALPAELPQHIEVDIRVLDRMDKTIHVRDLPILSSYSYSADPDDVVVALSGSRGAADMTPAEEEAETGEPAAAEAEGNAADEK